MTLCGRAFPKWKDRFHSEKSHVLPNLEPFQLSFLLISAFTCLFCMYVCGYVSCVKVIGQLAGVGPLLHYQCPYLLNHLSGLHFHHFEGTATAMFVG